MQPWTHQPAQRGRVRGIIEPQGVGFSQGRGADGKWEPWRLSVRLRPWQFDGGAVATDSVYLWKRAWLPQWLLRRILRPGTVVEFAVECDAGSTGRAKMLRYCGRRPDSGFGAALKAWRVGRTLSDPRFGTFAFIEAVEMFETRTRWCGREVTLSLTGDEKAALAHAHRAFDDAEAFEARARALIAKDLLETFNDNWRAEGEATYSAEAFLAHMTIEAITVDGNALVEFSFNDDELFLGHTVVATFDEERGESWANLHG